MVSEKDKADYWKNQIQSLEKENQKLKKDKDMLMNATQRLEDKFNSDKTAISELETLKKAIQHKDREIERLTNTIENQNLTIKSLQESILDNEVHKIPKMQKTILFLRGMVEELEREVKKLRENNVQD